jgi:site-specific recombinase XerD
MYLLNARHGKSTSEYVFTLNDKQINAGWVTHRFKKYIRRAGLNDRLKFHSLRHTFATWLVQRGSTLFEVQKLLGHSSSAVTEMYSHLQPEQMHSTVNRIDLNLN